MRQGNQQPGARTLSSGKLFDLLGRIQLERLPQFFRVLIVPARIEGLAVVE